MDCSKNNIHLLESAKTDMALGFIAERFGVNKAQEIAEHIEYIWNSDPDNT